MSDLKVRFAPSPTGFLHVGGARTALFNFLLAKQQKGNFLLRIEDTDVERSTQESVDAILQGMEWLGLSHDEGPIYQSDRFDVYKKHIDQLLEDGKAYKCYCTAEEVDARREALKEAGQKPKYDRKCINEPDRPGAPYCVRFKTPDVGRTEWKDAIKNTISFPNSELDDIIIQRTDGTPTYNFVVVVDDASMGMTLVIRGDDHVNNTPRQILMYEALGFPAPQFAHVPMILGADGQRLSKRHGATSVMAYRDMGFLPEALVNYLARLGWSHKNDEVFSMDDLIEKFSLKNVGKAPGVFNMDKLLWLNAHWIKVADPDRLAGLLVPFLEADVVEGALRKDVPSLVAVVKSLQTRSKTLVEMAEKSKFYFVAPTEYNMDAVAKFSKEHLTLVSTLVADALKGPAWTTYEAMFIEVCAANNLTPKEIGQPIRVALTGSGQSPSLEEVISILGAEESVRRLEAFIAFLKG